MLERAQTNAAKAAVAAGVDVRSAQSLDEVIAVRDTLGEIWADPQHVVPRELLRAVSRFGGVLLGAWDADTCVGGSLGFYGTARHGFRLHSHTTGVVSSHRGRHIGLALKLAQRVAALQVGVREVSWTFDPLLRANAWFNLERLGAIGVGYEPDFYGRRDDLFNAGDLTDRLVVEWAVCDRDVASLLDGERPVPTPPPGPGDQVLLAAVDDAPRAATRSLDPSRPAWIATPNDAIALRRCAPTLARDWRLAVREAFVLGLDSGMVASGFATGGWHRLIHRSS